MADRYLLESGAPDGYLLEDGSGVLLLDAITAASTLTDNFDDNATANTWVANPFLAGYLNTTGASAPEQNQRVEATVGANSGTSIGYVSTAYFRLDAAYVSVDYLNSPVGTSSFGWYLAVGDSNNCILCLQDNAQLYLQQIINGSRTTLATAVASGYSSTAHRWVRLRWGDVGDDNVYLDTAPSSAADPPASWTQQATAARPAGVDLTDARMAFGARSDGLGDTFYFDGFNTGTSGGTSVALSGQSVTGAVGSILAAAALALSGGSLSTSQGSVQQGAPLTGQSLTAAQGSVSSTVSVALTGQALTAARGSVVATTANALTGQTLAIGQGSVLQGAPITGQNTTTAIGSAAPVVSIALTGQALAGSAGSVSPASSLALSGQALTAARGSVVASPSFALTGQGVSAARGTVLAASSITLTGGALTVGQGTVTAAAPGIAALSGQSVVTAGGSVSAGLSIALTGQSVGTAQSILASATSLGISGQQATLDQGAFIFSASPTLVGQELTAHQATLVSEFEPEPRFWNPPPLTGRRMSVGRSR